LFSRRKENKLKELELVGDKPIMPMMKLKAAAMESSGAVEGILKRWRWEQ
jgi:hypothetical protein